MTGGPLGQTTELRAPAKLTLTLRIVGTRPDGYHLIDAEMVELELADRLHLTEGGEGLEIRGPFGAGVPTDDGNLVTRALHLTGRTASIVVDKQIPAGGGLGGGSADAAAVLRWADWTDVEGAAVLGADVPFCLVGGRARVTGIGELVEPLERRHLDITLVVPPFAVSTPAVYGAWDSLGGPRADGPNDLEPAAMEVESRLARFRDRLREVAEIEPVLAGSGATWFVHGHRGVADIEAALPDATVIRTRTAR